MFCDWDRLPFVNSPGSNKKIMLHLAVLIGEKGSLNDEKDRAKGIYCEYFE